MCKEIRNFNFALMIGLIILEITSFVIYIIILVNTTELDTTNEYYKNVYVSNLVNSFLSIALEIISIILIIIFGIHALYFKIIHKLIWYIVWYKIYNPAQ
jgi:hypothetical protein